MRFAGDYFGVSIAEPENRDSSKLLSYFPALRSTYGKTKGEKSEGPVQYGGTTAVQPFAGFKPNIGKDNSDQIKKPGTGTAFGGSKPGEF